MNSYLSCAWTRTLCRALALCIFLILSVDWHVFAQEPVPSQWYSGVRLKSGVAMDPIMPLARCDADTQAAIAQSIIDPVTEGEWVLYPVSAPKATTQSVALSALRRAPMWLVEESGTRQVRLPRLAAARVLSKGPCIHLASFDLRQAQKFELKDDADVLLSTTELSASTRLVRAKSPSHNAFANGEYTPKLERPVANWLIQRAALTQTISKDLPKPNDGRDRELCVPNHQNFNASLNGALRQLMSVRVQWCECAQRTAGACQALLDPKGGQPQWLAIVERRTGKPWLSLISPPTGIQNLSLIALATSGDLKDDVLWFLEEYSGGVVSSIAVRDGAQLRRQVISSYSGL